MAINKQEIIDAMLNNLPEPEQLKGMGFENAEHYIKVETKFIDLVEVCVNQGGEFSPTIMTHVIERCAATLKIHLVERFNTDQERFVARKELLMLLISVIGVALDAKIFNMAINDSEQPLKDDDEPFKPDGGSNETLH